MPLLARCLAALRRLGHDRRGNVAVVVAFAVLPLVAGAGVAIDGMLAYSTQDALQKSLDAAGLAAGRSLDKANSESDARAFLDSNFPNGPNSAAVTGFTFVNDDATGEITLTATARMPTKFMRAFGQNHVDVGAQSVIQRDIRQMELALVLDNTGSMAGPPFNAMQQAAKDLVGIVYGTRDTHPNLWVSVVPFVANVNIGTGHSLWLDAADAVRSGVNAYAPSTWKGCVMARPTPFDETDDPPSIKPYQSYLYPDATDNDWGAPRSPATDERLSAGNAGYGPNLGCGPAILPLTASKATVIAALNGMGAWSRGGTAGNQGMVWGWAALSPRWRGLWGGATPVTLPLDYDVTRTDKIVVMLTDGNNQVYDDPPAGPRGSDYTAYGRLNDFGYTTTSAGRAFWDQKQARICTAMKAKGVIIYTISFGGTPDATATTLLRSCATKTSQYYHAPDNATIRTVFKTIGNQLRTLRIKR